MLFFTHQTHDLTEAHTCVGGGGGNNAGGGGGALTWANNIAVTPGQVINVVVGAAGAASSFNGNIIANAGGSGSGNSPGAGGTW